MKTATLKATGSGIQEPLLRAGDRGDGPWGGDDGMSFGCGPWTVTQTDDGSGCPSPHPNCESVREQQHSLLTTIITMLLRSRSSPFCPFMPIRPTAVPRQRG